MFLFKIEGGGGKKKYILNVNVGEVISGVESNVYYITFNNNWFNKLINYPMIKFAESLPSVENNFNIFSNFIQLKEIYFYYLIIILGKIYFWRR